MKPLLLTLLLITSLSWVDVAFACSCTPQLEGPEGVEAGKADSDVVFSGFVVTKTVKTGWSPAADQRDVKPTDSWDATFADPNGFPSHYGVSFVRPLAVTVRLRVFHSWKGDVAEEVEVETSIGGGTCGYGFEVGESYLVYARQGKSGRITVNSCSRTVELRHAIDDVAALGPPSIDHVRNQAKTLSSAPR